MQRDQDTIAAIATAPGESAIAVVRVSGPESLSIADRIFRGPGKPPSRRRGNTFVHGNVVNPPADAAVRGESVLDDVLLLIYRAPHSYTGEHSVEIQGHGGTAAVQRILRTTIEAGARLAEPGEFTKRAFLNGRMDLLQAEAVLDLIRAKSDRAAAAAVEQLEGRLSHAFARVYDGLVEVAADIEATLDFAEDEVPEDVLADAGARLAKCRADLMDLLNTWADGRLLREGALVVISGMPNVGKSTLLNVLLGTDRAIVTPIPGTTRDIIEESVVIGGFPVRIADTAGLRETDCQIETEGIRRAKNLILRADANIYVIDGSQHITQQDIAIIGNIPIEKVIVVINKTDIACKVDKTILPKVSDVVEASLISGTGTREIRDAILRVVGASAVVPSHAAISERHRVLAASAMRDIDEAIRISSGDGQDSVLSAARIRSALESLGLITGKSYHEELIQSIFSRFCVGK